MLEHMSQLNQAKAIFVFLFILFLSYSLVHTHFQLIFHPRAQDLLLNDPVSIFNLPNRSYAHFDITKAPVTKRRKVMSEELEAAHSFSSSSFSDRKVHTVTIGNQYEISDLWRNTMVKVAERMQRAFQNSKQYTSAQNVSKLLQQLTTGKPHHAIIDFIHYCSVFQFYCVLIMFSLFYFSLILQSFTITLQVHV